VLIAAIGNSLDLLNIALSDDERLLTEYSIKDSQTPSEIIAKVLSDALTDIGRSVDDIKAVFTTLGPGSFTGIRVSLAFCKGISAARKIPLIGVPPPDVLARPLLHMEGHFLCPIIDAKKSEVFTSLYFVAQGTLKKFTDYRAVKPEAISRIIKKPCICFGSGVTLCEPFLSGSEGVTIEKKAYRTVTATALIRAGFDIIKNETKYETRPFYGRRSEAEIKFNVTVD
jgi:tRNA threonylcarbamoyladenosine biosynthesis protein TsaB